jgi:hypothetical protein
MIFTRLKLLERNLAHTDEQLREAYIEREQKLQKISDEISSMYVEYEQYMKSQEDLKDIESRIKVEIDYNLIKIMENKLKMDKEVYVMKKKLYDRTVRMREL